MKRLYTAFVASVLASALLLSACSGGGARTENRVTTVSKGQQLTDLQKAYASGAITRNEYERQRKQILAGE